MKPTTADTSMDIIIKHYKTMNKENNNMTLYNRMREVPKEALKTIQAGRLKGMSDINPMWRIKMLTEIFGVCGIGWRYEVVKMWLEPGAGNVVSAFTQINLYIKVNDEWSEPIPGIGGASYVSQEKSGAYTSDECYKMALTDAISVSCKALGMAADVYFANDRTKYTAQTVQPAPQQPEDDTLLMALQEIKGAQSINTLTQIFNNYSMIQGNPQFINALSAKKKELKR